MWFPYDEIDVNSYFFHIFLDVYVVQNKVLRVSKSLFRETYSNKEFIFDPYFAYQSYKFTAELHLTRKEVFFYFRKLEINKKKSYDKISKTLFIPYPTPNFVITSQQCSLFLHFLKRFSKFKTMHDQVWNQISRDLL